MQKRVVWILAASLVVMLVLLAALESGDEVSSARDAELVLPGLKDSLESLQSVTLSRSGDSVELVLDAQWVIANRDNFPADFGRLETLGSALAAARLVEAKTAKPEFHARLGLADNGDEDEAAVLVTMKSAAGTEFALLVGDEASSRTGRYVRKPGDNQTWLLDRSFEVSTAVLDWIDTDLLDLDYDRVASFSRTDAEGNVFSASRSTPEASEFVLDNKIPQGKKLSYETVLNAVARVPDNIRIEDLAAADKQPRPENAVVTTRFNTFDGVELEIALWRDDDGNWIEVSAAGAEQATLDAEQISSRDTEIEQINSRLRSRVVRISDYHASELEKSLSDYLSDEEPAESAVDPTNE